MRPRDPARPEVRIRGGLRRASALTRPTSASTRPTSGATAGDLAPARSSTTVPGFVSAAELLARPTGHQVPGCARAPKVDPAHSEADASPTPEAGRPWASGQLVFNAGQFESARSGFADYAKDGETAEQLRTRVNRIILEDLEQKVLALRALHAKFRDMDAGESFAGVVARSRPA